MSLIDITITINDKGVATYNSSSKQVAPDGAITIDAGEDASITFSPASGQSWKFKSPWISIQSLTPGVDDVIVTSQGSEAIVIADNNPASPQGSNYTYTLTTTIKTLDPAILNKGRR